MNKGQNHYFSAAVIARVVGCCAKTIKRRAAAAGWPQQSKGNRLEFIPPRALQAKCLAEPQLAARAGLRDLPISTAMHAEVYRANNRYAAVCGLEAALQAGVKIEIALARVSRAFTFTVSPRSLRMWKKSFSAKGFTGLQETKRGNSGRKSKLSIVQHP